MKALVKFINSRWLMLALSILLVAGALAAHHIAQPDYITGDRGVVFPSVNLWVSNPTLSMWINVACTLGVALLITAFNRTFNLLRAATVLDASMFLAMSLSVPLLLTQLYTGTVLCITLLLCLFLLFLSYGDTRATQYPFLIFFILSGMSMTQYSYAVYMPVFAIGMLQMRMFTPRALVAALLGIATPWWLILGSTLVPVSQIHVPDFNSFFSTFNLYSNVGTIVAATFSALLLAGAWVFNLPQMIAYNAHNRAYNGTLSVLSLVTIVAACADFTNLAVYVPALFMCSSLQIGRLFAGRGARAGGVVVIAVILIFIALYLCQIMPLTSWSTATYLS